VIATAMYDELGVALHALIIAIVGFAIYACNRRS
jgi:hypothetical protein